MSMTKRVWMVLAVVFFGSFAGLGMVGKEIYQIAPPIPEKVVVAGTGEVLYTKQQIMDGQKVWRSIGGHSVGTVWGHGSYLAPDWSADWLHRELVDMLNIYSAQVTGQPYDSLGVAAQAALKATLKQEVRTNTYSEETDTITVSPTRAQAIKNVDAYYTRLFSDDKSLESLREDYAIKSNPIPDDEKRKMLNAFFFWAAWACATDRPGDDVTYTNNWPGEELIDNEPSASLWGWSIFSIVVLLAGIGFISWFYAIMREHEEYVEVPETDPLAKLVITPSMRATFKYFAVVAILFILQITMGAVTAHFAVEGHEFYGIPLADYVPYALSRTWHLQLAVFWIATSWLGAGLYIAPAITGKEPKFQVWGVNFLFVAAAVIIFGSMFGEWLGIQQKLDFAMNYWFGHQGYEYIELGRFWQAFLFVGLVLWLILVTRALWSALWKKSVERQMIWMLFLSSGAIGLFYGAGLMYGDDTHYSVVEYWRWWVVHLWVEGFFEVFATTVIAFIFTRLGLVGVKTATYAVVFAALVFLTGGILGTNHHLYFAGAATSAISLGATFSALEVVPLVLIGYEAYENYRFTKIKPWLANYKWIIYFFVAVAFWNLVGAGILGFMINPPISLYYVQGLNSTPIHGHAALFGVYGMLGLGLMLFCLRGMANPKAWDDRILKWTFWCLNGGLVAMLVMSLIPVGVMQMASSLNNDMWYARSADFMQQDIIQFFIWMRVPGDVVFGIGGLLFAWFIAKLWLGRNA